MGRDDASGIATLSRRDLLLKAGAGFGAVALAAMLDGDRAIAAGGTADAATTGPRPPHFPAKARSVIFLFMEGGPSHIDTFDPKPLINRLDGQPIPPGFKGHLQAMTAAEAGSRIMASPRQWTQHGESGLWVSDWLPHIAECVDDIAVIRSCWTDAVNHAGAVYQMNCGTPIGGRPSLGSWASYGLGTENEDLPAFVVMLDSDTARVFSGVRNWGPGFLPAAYQGTRLYASAEPIRDLRPPDGVGDAQQRGKLDLLGQTQQAPRRAAIAPEPARGPHPQLSARLPHAGRGAGGRGPVARDRRDPPPLRDGRRGDRRVRPQLPAGAPAGRARRPVRPALPRRRQQVGLAQ